MNWVAEAKSLFMVERPAHFTNHIHCEECAEHDETLLSGHIDTIGLKELGKEGWDPICFSNNKGKIYYMPSFIRLCLETIDDEFYLGQFLFHLLNDGEDNSLFLYCSTDQKLFVSSFLEFLINEYTEEIDAGYSTDDILRAHKIWSKI